ncbi:MAG: histidine triad nucleotide-binding protein [Anaerolineae bacterium]|nr:histidine triad nucleotide-binding protein [Anaerolineae bacterium]
MGSRCVFCGIIRGEVAADIVYRDASVTAFRDLAPQAPCHVLVVPNQHVRDLSELGVEKADLFGTLLWAAREIAAAEGLAQRGYRLVLNVGADGGQSIQHLHLHILGGRRLGWPPG